MLSLPRLTLLAPIFVTLSSASMAATDEYLDSILPYVQKYCVECHNSKVNKGELDLTHYVGSDVSASAEAMATARYCWMDTIGCGLYALQYPACTRLLSPTVPGTELRDVGARVPGTAYELDPIRAARNIGAMVRWLDFNDT